MALRQQIVNLAKAEADFVKNNFWQAKNQGMVVLNSETYRTQSKYTKALGWSANQWCADFVTWLADSLDGKLNNNDIIRNSIVPSGSNGRWVPNFRSINNAYAKYYQRGSYVPREGDFAILNNSGHIGIVNWVNRTTGEFTYIDGNNTYKYSGYRSVSESSRKSYKSLSGLAGFVSVNYEALDRSMPSPISQDRYESNNTKSSATYLRGETGTLSNLTLHSSSDVDWFQFYWHGDGTASNQIRLSTRSSNESFDLYSPSGALLRSNTTMVCMAAYDAAGTYYVKVHGANGSTSKNYSLCYNLKQNVYPDRYESNNNRYSATMLQGNSGSLSNLNLHTGIDEDWFKVTLNGTGTTRDTVSVSNSSGGAFIQIYNAAGSLAKTAFGVNMNFNGLPAGIYYAKVYSPTHMPTSRYTFNWNISPKINPITQREYESNNTKYSADTLRGSTGTMKGSIGTTTDVDWFKFTLGSRGMANDKLELTSGSNSQRLVLYDANGSQLGSKMYRSVSLSGKAAGTYYVKVYDSVGFRSGDYTLTWNTASSSRAANSTVSRSAVPTTQSLTNSSDVMYNSAAGAFASYLNSSGTTTQAVSRSGSDSLRKYGTLVQA